MNRKAPDYRLVVNGTNITPKVNGRLIDLTLSEDRGGEADTLSLTLSDHDGALEIPPKGASIEVAIGWRGEGLTEKGTYVVDDAQYTWPPNQITISARSADMRGQLPARRTRSWHQETIGSIVQSIAGSRGLNPVIGAGLAARQIDHMDQTDESDINFLTRLAEKHDAIATVKAGRLLFLPKGEAKTASGATLPLITITPSSGDSGTYQEKDREDYTGVTAFYNDTDTGEQKSVTAGTNARIKRLRGTYPTAAEALAEANAELGRISRGEATFGLTLAIGRPELSPEYRLKVSGIKPQVDAREWVVASVSHSLSDGGFTTSISAETLGS